MSIKIINVVFYINFSVLHLQRPVCPVSLRHISVGTGHLPDAPPHGRAAVPLDTVDADVFSLGSEFPRPSFRASVRTHVTLQLEDDGCVVMLLLILCP